MVNVLPWMTAREEATPWIVMPPGSTTGEGVCCAACCAAAAPAACPVGAGAGADAGGMISAPPIIETP
jgi:hypothetical protein